MNERKLRWFCTAMILFAMLTRLLGGVGAGRFAFSEDSAEVETRVWPVRLLAAKPADEPSDEIAELPAENSEPPERQIAAEVTKLPEAFSAAEADAITIAGACSYAVDKAALLTRPSALTAKADGPRVLKRGLANTLKELLMSAEYIMASGNEQVILCERGIRTFDDYTRNTLDLAAVPMLHELSHLPVIVDPSHATGINRLVPPMALAATAGGADGLIIEVHNDPIHALCDGAQSLRPEQYDELAKKVAEIRKVVTA